MIDKIISYIRKNRVSTTELADCMGKSGQLKHAHVLNQRHFKVGKVHYCYADHESNWNVHKHIQEVEENAIVVIDDLGANGRAIFGSLVAKYLILYKQALAIVTNGHVRDSHDLVKENYPIWCRGSNPIGCFNREPNEAVDAKLLAERRAYFNKSIGVCDDTGVVIITPEFINEAFYKKLEWIEEQEDVWFDCIDRKKWNTFETVCLKKYEDK